MMVLNKSMACFLLGPCISLCHGMEGQQEAWHPNKPMVQNVVQEKDDKEIMTFSAANQSDVLSLHELGVTYLQGQGVEKDVKRAITCLTQASKKGHADSSFKLGEIFMKEFQSGSHALEYYKKAADQGHTLGYFNCAWIYFHGLDVERSFKKAAQFYVRGKQGKFHLSTLLGFKSDYPVSSSLGHEGKEKIESLKSVLAELQGHYNLDGQRACDRDLRTGDIANQVVEFCANSLQMLENLKEPGYLITCLDIKKPMGIDHNLDELFHKIDGEEYLSFRDENLIFINSKLLVMLFEREGDVEGLALAQKAYTYLDQIIKETAGYRNALFIEKIWNEMK